MENETSPEREERLAKQRAKRFEKKREKRLEQERLGYQKYQEKKTLEKNKPLIEYLKEDGTF